jgi:hypothetical protein
VRPGPVRRRRRRRRAMDNCPSTSRTATALAARENPPLSAAVQAVEVSRTTPACSMPLPPPTCSPGRPVGSRSTRVSGSRSIDRDVPSYFQSLEHLLRYCARPPVALERLSVSRGPDGRIARARCVLPRHTAANWVGPGRGRKSTRPGANGVVVAFRLLSECETIPGLRPLGNLRLLRTSCPRTRPDPEDPHVRDRHPQPLTGIGREASKPRERPTGTRSAQTREQRH